MVSARIRDTVLLSVIGSSLHIQRLHKMNSDQLPLTITTLLKIAAQGFKEIAAWVLEPQAVDKDRATLDEAEHSILKAHYLCLLDAVFLS
jgi:hypothetical protein